MDNNLGELQEHDVVITTRQTPQSHVSRGSASIRSRRSRQNRIRKRKACQIEKMRLDRKLYYIKKLEIETQKLEEMKRRNEAHEEANEILKTKNKILQEANAIMKTIKCKCNCNCTPNNSLGLPIII
ncbi:uncharacterized protein LOC114336192 [Diabrotica virgifera virgifera]|uniref:Uncharacterized protein LOC114336192 n=1 Tax=Diabrotica virgifera virgifera TaxID=50390 RepID=A0A6P7GDV4_DIAVI|nr:uncharacterized protein LOC114336192 [Diabrotica virgifera virgifera]